MMKKNFKLPILLLAVVVMLSIFYIKDATSVDDTLDVNSGDLDVSVLNPDFTEARISSINEVNALIKEYETSLASNTLDATEVEKTTILIDELVTKKNNEIALEEKLISLYSYDDVLVLLDDTNINISVYSDTELSPTEFISVTRLSYENFDDSMKVKITLINSLE